MRHIIFEEDLRQSDEYAQYMKSMGWKVERIKSKSQTINIFVKRFGLVNEARVLRCNLPIPWIELKSILKKNRVYICRLEPRGGSFYEYEFFQNGFKIDKNPFRATKTSLIDLTVSEHELLNKFKRARSWIKKIKIQDSRFKIQCNEFYIFFELWKKATRLQKIWSSSKNDYEVLLNSFENKCFCVTIDKICGCLVLLHKNTAYYYYGATLPQARNEALGYLVVWTAMKEAKRRGCKTWDWEGIYDARWPNESWLGFSQFKKSFGGTEVEMPGSFVRKSVYDLLGL